MTEGIYVIRRGVNPAAVEALARRSKQWVVHVSGGVNPAAVEALAKRSKQWVIQVSNVKR
jgi:hypothetical protein